MARNRWWQDSERPFDDQIVTAGSARSELLVHLAFTLALGVAYVVVSGLAWRVAPQIAALAVVLVLVFAPSALVPWARRRGGVTTRRIWPARPRGLLRVGALIVAYAGLAGLARLARADATEYRVLATFLLVVVALGAAMLHVACLEHGQVVRDAPPRPLA